MIAWIGARFMWNNSFFVFDFNCFNIVKNEKNKINYRMLMSVTSIIAMILFVTVQKANGNPDSGKEFEQFYFPILVFVVFMAIGFVSSITLVKK